MRFVNWLLLTLVFGILPGFVVYPVYAQTAEVQPVSDGAVEALRLRPIQAQMAGSQPVADAVPTKTPPDVQIVAFPMPDGTWAMTTVYPKKIPRAAAEKRVNRLLQVAGWKGSGFEFTDKALERAPNTFDDLPTVPVMSSLTFQTTANVVDFADGTIAVEPFARAFRDLNRVHVTVLIPLKFTFRGLRHYSDKNLDVTLSEGQGAWTYLLNIKNHNLDTLNLPRYERLKPTTTLQSAQAESGAKPGLSRGVLGTGLAVLLAVGAGTIAFLLFQRIQAR